MDKPEEFTAEKVATLEMELNDFSDRKWCNFLSAPTFSWINKMNMVKFHFSPLLKVKFNCVPGWSEPWAWHSSAPACSFVLFFVHLSWFLFICPYFCSFVLFFCSFVHVFAHLSMFLFICLCLRILVRPFSPSPPPYPVSRRGGVCLYWNNLLQRENWQKDLTLIFLKKKIRLLRT